MNLFSDFMERIKAQAGFSKDKEIAELLGMSTTAFSERKKRDSVPIKEVFELARKRPELGIDPDWIVTGSSKHMETASMDEASLLQCYQKMNAQQQHQLRQIALLWSGLMKLVNNQEEKK
jgi:transcriptional regulator with XRE-family HTH domain